ncbi:MAG: hypothetical protein HGB03_04115 [Candidatus Yonathbacteria bacterium]|nr:hypothetical protein [Candidatus Yonathbacteria bacterium]NTW47585.1 hypothetical protein [Candidatus Yonathbacteria bacterium]
MSDDTMNPQADEVRVDAPVAPAETPEVVSEETPVQEGGDVAPASDIETPAETATA